MPTLFIVKPMPEQIGPLQFISIDMQIQGFGCRKYGNFPPMQYSKDIEKYEFGLKFHMFASLVILKHVDFALFTQRLTRQILISPPHDPREMHCYGFYLFRDGCRKRQILGRPFCNIMFSP